jgi:hypothetical protein
VPKTTLAHFQKEDGSVPVLDWLLGLERKAQTRCLAQLERLEKHGRVNYRMLPEREIAAALVRKASFEKSPSRRTFKPE